MGVRDGNLLGLLMDGVEIRGEFFASFRELNIWFMKEKYREMYSVIDEIAANVSFENWGEELCLSNEVLGD